MSDYLDRIIPAYATDSPFVRAAITAIVEGEIAECQKQLWITSLAVPLEDELHERISEACKYLAMEQGFTLSGIARLLVDCQRRMADDWVEIGNLRRKSKTAERAEADAATLRTALDLARLRLSANTLWSQAGPEALAIIDAALTSGGQG